MKTPLLNRTCFSIFPLVAFLVLSVKTSTDFIDWSADRKLSWDDFKGKPESGSDRAALSSIKITVDFKVHNNVLDWDITCRFNTKRSWGKIKTEYILSHEQTHFNITEIHARKLHQRLSAYAFNSKSFQTDVQRIYNQAMKEENEMQSLYDKETNHSIIKEKQRDWQDKVKSLLEETQTWSGYNKPVNE